MSDAGKGTTDIAVVRKHEGEDAKRFMQFLRDFDKESDRAAVILGAAKLDEGLYQLLAAILVPVPSSSDDLLDTDRPLGTFSARISIAFRLGAIDADVARALHLVRRIRNSLAHEASGALLDEGAHADRIRELARPFRPYAKFDAARELAAKSHNGLAAELRTVVAILSMRLGQALEMACRVQGKPLPLVAPSWTKV